TGSGCPATDQRGEPRPVGPACDVGAVEVQTTASTSTSISTTVTTTSVTVTTVTTSSTLPEPCAGVPVAATFESIACRLDALDVEMAALGSVPRIQQLRDRLGEATERAKSASDGCAASDLKAAKKLLKGSLKKLGRLRRLAKASKTIPDLDELL